MADHGHISSNNAWLTTVIEEAIMNGVDHGNRSSNDHAC